LIDGDHAFDDSLVKNPLTGVHLNLKSVVLCFRQMRAPIDARAMRFFLSLDPYRLLSQWLMDLERYYVEAIGTKPRQGMQMRSRI
jgi:hypothetical protein